MALGQHVAPTVSFEFRMWGARVDGSRAALNREQLLLCHIMSESFVVVCNALWSQLGQQGFRDARLLIIRHHIGFFLELALWLWALQLSIMKRGLHHHECLGLSRRVGFFGRERAPVSAWDDVTIS